MKQSLAELQTQLAFQEDTIEALDSALSRQQQDMLEMGKTVKLLQQQLKQVLEELEDFRQNQRPPHY